MKNYRLTIQYDGTIYSGWQRQPNVLTVQQLIEDKIQIITKQNVNLLGSGRTDTGVHALGQVANFRIESELNLKKFQHSLNSILPADIAIIKIDEVDKEFHSRFDAKIRSYLYMINSEKSPFYNLFSYYYPPMDKIDLKKMNSLSSKLIGTYDFTSFAKKGTETKDNICDISFSRWRKSKNLYFYRIDGNRFLHGMVRAIVGTILEIAEKEYPESKIQEILKLKNREAAGRGVPPNGLFLYRVKY